MKITGARETLAIAVRDRLSDRVAIVPAYEFEVETTVGNDPSSRFLATQLAVDPQVLIASGVFEVGG